MGVFNLLKFSSEENMANFRKDVSKSWSQNSCGGFGYFLFVFSKHNIF